MKRSIVLCMLVLACYWEVPSLSAQAAGKQQALLSQARQSYYNLHNEGLASFECSVTPNWELLLQDQRRQNPEAADKAIQVLNQLHFNASVAPNGKVTLTHNDLSNQSESMMNALKQIYGGMEQMASGFFDTWKLFMLNAPFPEVTSEFQLVESGPQYQLTYKEDTADVATTMGRDFAISNMKVKTPEFDSSIQPVFKRTPRGFVLNGYQATYNSQKPDEATVLQVFLEYQEVQGFQMLQKLHLSGSYGGTPFAVELGFSGCKVTKKAAGN